MYLQLISKLSISIFLMTTLTLLVSLVLAFANHDSSYSGFINSQTITRHNLQIVLVIASIFLLSVTALITWLICLYSSFKVAGPLYRFTQNLLHAPDPDSMLPVRSNDIFQELSSNILSSAKTIQQHEFAIKTTIEQCLYELDKTKDQSQNENLHHLLDELLALESRVKLHN